MKGEAAVTAPGRRSRKAADAEAFAAELQLEENEIENKHQPSVLDDPRASAGQLRQELVQERAEAGLAPIQVDEKMSAKAVRELVEQARAEAREEALAEMRTIPHVSNELLGMVSAGDPNVVVIHFLEDGLTAPESPTSERVWYRGEELAVDKTGPVWPLVRDWIGLSNAQQYDRWGVQYFDQGPWPYGMYDTSDPELSDEERKVLEKANRRRLGNAQGMPAGTGISKSRSRTSRAPSFLQGSKE